MPPLPTLRISVIRDLEERLKGLPRGEVLRCVRNAEELVFQLEPGQGYPEDWLLFRLAGLSADTGPTPAVVVGGALVMELSSLVERLSEFARLEVREVPGALGVPEVCRRWNISRATLARLRKKGLIARRCVGGKGRACLVFAPAVVENFERAHASELARAGAYSRIPEEVEARMVRRAARYKRALGCTLNQAAARIADRFGRSHEAVRQVLRRHDQRTEGEGIFNQSEPLSERRKRVALRATRFGIDPGRTARKYRRTRAGVRRAINLARAESLAMLLARGGLDGPVAPTYQSEEAERAFLNLPPCQEGLGAAGKTDLLAFLDDAHVNRPPVAVEERARLAAYQFLRWRAKERIRHIERLHPSALLLDEIETGLRLASRLKAELVRSQLRLAVQTVESRLGRPLREMPPGVVAAVVLDLLSAVGEAVDHFDPMRTGRLAAAASLAVDKVGVRMAKEGLPKGGPGKGGARAVVVLTPGYWIPDWTLRVNKWQRWLEPLHGVRGAVEGGKVPAAQAALLVARYGWGGHPPRTIVESAKLLGVTPVRAAVMEQKAIASAVRSR